MTSNLLSYEQFVFEGVEVESAGLEGLFNSIKKLPYYSKNTKSLKLDKKSPEAKKYGGKIYFDAYDGGYGQVFKCTLKDSNVVGKRPYFVVCDNDKDTFYIGGGSMRSDMEIKGGGGKDSIQNATEYIKKYLMPEISVLQTVIPSKK